jgi:hypothetical protein
VTAMVVIAFMVLIGPLALLYGADSRIDDRRNGWPRTRSQSLLEPGEGNAR